MFGEDKTNFPQGIPNPDKLGCGRDLFLGEYFSDQSEAIRTVGYQTAMFGKWHGWLLGEHQFTSKVLAYEESMRVPMIIAGPKARTGVEPRFALNIDLAPTILELAGVPLQEEMDGTSLLPLVRGSVSDWRSQFVYEAPDSQLGSYPLWAVRTQEWKYIATRMPSGENFEELYDLVKDPSELTNLASQPALKPKLDQFRADIAEHRGSVE